MISIASVGWKIISSFKMTYFLLLSAFKCVVSSLKSSSCISWLTLGFLQKWNQILVLLWQLLQIILSYSVLGISSEFPHFRSYHSMSFSGKWLTYRATGSVMVKTLLSFHFQHLTWCLKRAEISEWMSSPRIILSEIFETTPVTGKESLYYNFKL